jgi:YjbE family integral membrane protein
MRVQSFHGEDLMIFLIALFKIIVVNIILSGDNAVVIALASRNLPKKQQKLAILWGSAGAIVLRILLTIIAVFLLSIPYLQFFGGLLLIWIAVKLIIEEDDNGEISSHSNLLEAIKTIIIADIIMSLDNTLAIAAVANGNYLLLAIGLALSIPLIIFGSQIIVLFMEKYPIIVYIGAGLIAWTAGEMIIRDKHIAKYIPHIIERLIPAAITVSVVIGCWLLNLNKKRSSKDVPETD